jgi:hypothetical protein
MSRRWRLAADVRVSLADWHRARVRRQQRHEESVFRPSLEGLEERIVPAGITPDEVRNVYGFNSIPAFTGPDTPIPNAPDPATGAGQHIAIIDVGNDPTVYPDLDTFDQQYSLTTNGPKIYSTNGPSSAFLTVYNEGGVVLPPYGAPAPGKIYTPPSAFPYEPAPASGTAAEIQQEAMDVEWAHVIAPDAHIDLIELNSNSQSDLLSGVQTAANLVQGTSPTGATIYDSVIAIGSGVSEYAAETKDDTNYFSNQTHSHPGQTFLGAVNPPLGGGYPAFSPYVVAVASTTIGAPIPAPSSLLTREFANDVGGFSSIEKEPSYQKLSRAGTLPARGIPDVAILGDPNELVFVSTSGSSPATTGAGVATAEWAGLFALVNQGRADSGNTNLSGNGQTLTALYNFLPASDFNDVPPAGWDTSTGLGSPKGDKIVPALAGYGQITISPTTLPSTTLGLAYPTQTITATSNLTPNVTVSYTLPGGPSSALGLQFVSTNNQLQIFGTPTAVGTITIDVTAQDLIGDQATQVYTINVNPQVLLTQVGTWTSTVGLAYTPQTQPTIFASLGSSPDTLSYTITSGSLPAGLSINNSGAQLSITGTPTAPGTATIQVTGTDSAGYSTPPTSYVLTINPAITLTPNPALQGMTNNLQNAVEYHPYSQTVTAAGGTGTLQMSYLVTGGTLPPGLTPATNGNQFTLSGTPTGYGSATIQVTGTDSVGATTTQTYNLSISPSVSLSPLPTASTTLGVAFPNNDTITANTDAGTGTTTIGFSVTSGSFAALGLAPPTITNNQLTISGTPTASGSVTFLVTGSNNLAQSNQQSYTVTVNPPPSLSPSTLPATTVGLNYNQTITANNGTNPVVGFALTSGVDPATIGLKFTTQANQLTISGTPTAAGTVNFTVTAIDAVGASIIPQPYSLTINPPVVLTPSTGFGGTIGVPYNQTVTASGGTGTQTISLNTPIAGTFAALGLTAKTSGNQLTITGNPTATGTVTFQVIGTDSLNATTSQTYTVTINPPILLSATSLPASTQGLNYNQTITATGGTNTLISYSLAAGNTIPSGLNFIANGGTLTISGTPTASGTVNFTVNATDAVGATIPAQTFQLVINPAITLSTTGDWTGTVGAPFSMVVSADKGTGTGAVTTTYTFLPGGTLPNSSTGLTFTPNGNTLTISGTPTTAGSVAVQVTATDSVGASTTQTYGLTINPAISLNLPALPSSTVGVPYNQALIASGGTGALALSVSPTGLTTTGALGLTFSTSGNQLTISGVPTAGSVSFQLTATDAVGGKTAQNYTLTINPAITLSTSGGLNTTLGTGYSETITALGGTSPIVSYNVTAGSIPAGLNFNAGGNKLTITGTPSATGTVTFTVSALDAAGTTTSQSFTLVVNPAITLPVPAPAISTEGVPYTQTITASGGTGTDTVKATVTSGQLPQGLTFATSGNQLTIGGIPSSFGTVAYNVTVTDSVGASATQNYALTINPPISLSSPQGTTVASTVGVALNQSITATGGTGTPTVSYVVVSGSIPAGLSFNTSNNTLNITGTPTGTGTVVFQVIATDSAGGSTTQNFTLTVNPVPTLAPTIGLDSTVGVSYNQNIKVNGGTGVAAVTYSVTSGAIPAGLGFNPGNGGLSITGTPTATGTVTFAVTATDSLGVTTTQTFTVNIHPPVVLGNNVLPVAAVGTAYDQRILVGGGTGPTNLTVTVVNGALPPGLSFAPETGDLHILGTPTGTGTVTFTVTATDSVGASTSQTRTLTVTPPLSLGTNSLAVGATGSGYNQTITATGGVSPVNLSFNITSGAVPAGLSISVQGNQLVISGTPTATGSVTFTVTAVDSSGDTVTQSRTLVVVPGNGSGSTGSNGGNSGTGGTSPTDQVLPIALSVAQSLQTGNFSQLLAGLGQLQTLMNSNPLISSQLLEVFLFDLLAALL